MSFLFYHSTNFKTVRQYDYFAELGVTLINSFEFFAPISSLGRPIKPINLRLRDIE